MQNNKIIVSIAVCTYNRSKCLQSCLDSLVHQKDVDSKDYELLVIDNNSADGTNELVEEYISRCRSIKIYYYFEPEIGLSHARNRAIKEARGEYIAYIDDDAIAYPDWIYQIIKFTRKYPHVYVFGGHSSRYAEIPVPKWVPPDYGTVDLGEKEKEIKGGILGCNMMFRRSFLEKLGGFNPNLGMVGKTIRYGEEDEIFIKIIRLNLPIMYSPYIKIKHLLEDYKLNLFWRLKSVFAKTKTGVMQKNSTLESTHVAPALLNLLTYKNILSAVPIENKIYNIILALDIIIAVFYAYVLKVIRKFQKK